VRCSPRANRDGIDGMRDGVLLARVRAAPHDGEANRALCRLIADRVGVGASRVSVVRGGRSREKLIAVSGVDREALLAMLGGGEDGA